MLVSKTLEFALPPTRNPNTSQWHNIGCIGSQMQISRVGHVHLSFFCVDFIRVESRFSVDYGLTVLTQCGYRQIFIAKPGNVL